MRSNKFGDNSGSQEGEETDGPVIPLLLQNKPPVETSNDQLNDVELRPNIVSKRERRMGGGEEPSKTPKLPAKLLDTFCFIG